MNVDRQLEKVLIYSNYIELNRLLRLAKRHVQPQVQCPYTVLTFYKLAPPSPRSQSLHPPKSYSRPANYLQHFALDDDDIVVVYRYRCNNFCKRFVCFECYNTICSTVGGMLSFFLLSHVAGICRCDIRYNKMERWTLDMTFNATQ